MNTTNILNVLENELGPLSFECYPFKLKWYNSQVDSVFRFDSYHDDTFAVLVLNTPSMFEKLFLPFLFDNYKNNLKSLDLLNDPIDACLSIIFSKVKEKLDQMFKKNLIDIEIEIIKDYEMVQRRAKILMQTCAHISGAGYFYDKKIIEETFKNDFNNNTKLKKNFMGVCLHPTYGGWFALRSVFIFKNFLVNDSIMQQKLPVDMLNGDKNLILDLLEKFNFNWKDWTYRDMIPVKEKYSEIQKDYFETEPKHRKDLIRKWLRFPDQKQLCSSYFNQTNKIEQFDNKDYLIRNFFVI